MKLHIKIDDHEVLVPQRWNDLPLRQQLMVYGILMTDAHGLFEPHELLPGKKVMLACALLNVTPRFLDGWQAGCVEECGGDAEEGRQLYLAQLDEVMKCADFLFEKTGTEGTDDNEQPTTINYQLNLGLTKCPWPVLARRHKLTGKPINYHAPADALANITIYEMAAVFTLFEDFMAKQDEAIAHRLLATIYRRHKPRNQENRRMGYEGDRRLPYLRHESTVEQRIPHMAALPRPVKQLLLFWVASCRQAIVQAYPAVFSQKSSEGQDGRQYRWGGVLLSLADGLVHLDAVAAQNHQNALTYLSYLEDQRRKEKLALLGKK